MQILSLAAWLVIFAAVFIPLERLFAVRPARVFRAQWLTDLGWYFINAIVPALVLAVPLATLASLTQRIDGLAGWYAMVAALPLWAKLPLAFLVNDIGSYWAHRWSHRNAFLWRFHAVHHSAETVDWLVNTRAHPVDMVVTRFSGLLLVYLLGLASVSGSGGGVDPMLFAVTVWGTFWSFLIHANVRWRFGPLEQLISTPAFHHWHHSNDENRDRNFAAIFPFIDRLFGTLYLPKGFPTVYGIDGEVASSLPAQLVDPLLGPVRPKPVPTA
ncbi:sterol desaturase family protein [Sandaracinobacteroides saxicola]|nr:sterol desaturase family protein [Sandaracinobacteroides saxicola]